jgi:hypothetical protein
MISKNYYFIVMYIFLILISIMSVSALYICDNPIRISATCSVLTPSLSCGTYNYSIFDNVSTLIQYGNLSVFSGNIYYFNVTLLQGDYLALLCDGSSRVLTVSNNNNGSAVPIEISFNQEQNTNYYVLWLLIFVFVILIVFAFLISPIMMCLSAIPLYFAFIQLKPLLTGNALVISSFCVYSLMVLLMGMGLLLVFGKKKY